MDANGGRIGFFIGGGDMYSHNALHNFCRTVSRIWPGFGPSITVDSHTTLEVGKKTVI